MLKKFLAPPVFADDEEKRAVTRTLRTIVIVSMIMLYTFPQIGLWLPNLLYK